MNTAVLGAQHNLEPGFSCQAKIFDSEVMSDKAIFQLWQPTISHQMIFRVSRILLSVCALLPWPPIDLPQGKGTLCTKF